MTDDLPEETKLTRSKRRWAAEGKFLTGRVARPDSERLPPGQHLVRDWPVLDLGTEPAVTTARWRLAVNGLVEAPVTLDWAGFMAMPQSVKRSDIHCVTTWSRYDNDWQGVAVRDLLDLVMPTEAARAVLLTSFDGYTTNLVLEDFASEDAILATHWQGAPLSQSHGGPMRLVLPHLYFWKSAKWLREIRFRAEDGPGYWERYGYHLRGDPWTEQRYSVD